jgi:hypothetical protein
MSLHKAVYQTVDVPYRKVENYGDITEPPPTSWASSPGSPGGWAPPPRPPRCSTLTRGMGGGKSRALVGLFHMADSPEEFFAPFGPPTIAS